MKAFPHVLTKQEERLFRSLSTPKRIQDFIDALACNFETDGETVMSPRRVLKAKRAHCLEGALLAAAILWYHGEKPLLLDLKSTKHDFDHVIALFKRNGYWGAISKTNHAVLRYREPVYKTLRELVLSYFHEYFTDAGVKTLRSYSKPFDCSLLEPAWLTSEEELWEIGAALDDSPHVALLTAVMIRNLRKADAIEIKAGTLLQYNP